MKRNLTINLVPYRITSDAIDLYFSSHSGGKGQRIIKQWVPSDLIVPEDHEGYTYWSLDMAPNATRIHFEFLKDIGNAKTREYFLKRIFTQLIQKHFQDLGFVVGRSYIGDTRVWVKADFQPAQRNYHVYDKFSVKIDVNTLIKGSGVFLSFDGRSFVSILPLKDLNLPDLEIVSKVIHNNRVFSRNEDDFPRQLEECRAVFNRNIEHAIGVVPEKEPFSNKYRHYYDQVSDFHKRHLSGQSIGGYFEILSTGFFPVPENATSRVDEESNLLEFKDHVRNVNVYDGLKRSGGPYFSPELSNLRFVFIFMERDKEAANKLFSFLNKGYKNFPGLEKYVAVPFKADLDKTLKLQNEATIVTEVIDWLALTKFDEDKKYFVLYVSPINKDEEDIDRHAIYFKIKELLLERELSSQVVFKDHMNKDAFNFYLPNIAVAILAKLGGIPWRLPYPLKKDLVIGVGVHRDFELSSAYIGTAICFHNDGQFEEFKVFPSSDIGKVSQSLKRSIQEFASRSGGCDRLVIHYYKDIGPNERKMLDSAMHKLEINVPYIFVTVKDTESRDYVIFDESFDGRIPSSGTIVRLKSNEFLLCNNTRYHTSTGQKLLAYPFPVKIKVSSQPRELANDFMMVREILDQVYEFSRIYWKSIRQRNKPVTIEYSELIAEVVSHFSNKTLPDTKTAKQSLWFL